MRRALSFLLSLFVALSPAWAVSPGQYELLFSGNNFAGAGQAISLAIPSQNFSAIADLTPFKNYINGWTGDLTLKYMNIAGATSAYNCSPTTGICGSWASPLLSVAVTRPGFTSSATTTTASSQINAIGWLRQSYPNYTLPTELQSGSNAQISLAFNDFVYADDTVGTATLAAGLYASPGGAATANVATSGIPVTNSSTRPYPRPVCAWVTEPGLRFDGTANAVIEAFCGHAYGGANTPLAAVKIGMSDGTTTVSHVVSAMTASTRQASTTCTATTGSNVLTSCGNTAWVKVGQRLAVPGVPGQPAVLSFTSTTITLGATATCTPTLLGALTCTNASVAHGQALADGGFVGQTVTNANLTTNPATLVVPTGLTGSGSTATSLVLASVSQGQFAVGEWVFYPGQPVGTQMYISALGTGTGGAGTYTLHCASTCAVLGSGVTITASPISGAPTAASVTTATVSTSSTVGVASAATTTFNHNYQGTTGTVTVTAGSKLPVYAATFTPTDFASLSSNVPIYFRLQAYPQIGDIVLDSQTGADGTQCEWFWRNVNSGVCNSSSAAWFPTNGEAISPNLHNLFAYYDTNVSWAPRYLWVNASGTCTTVSCISSSATDPGANSGYFATIGAALTAAKSYNNNVANRTTVHNDLNGLVFCLTAAASGTNTYAGFAATINTSVTAWKPGMTVTSAVTTANGGGTCPGPYTVGGNPPGVTFSYGGTAGFQVVGPNTHINNITIAGSNETFAGVDNSGNTTSFPTTYDIFENDIWVPGSLDQIFRTGFADLFNNYVDESQTEGNIFFPDNNSGSRQELFNTMICGTNVALKSNFNLWVSLANIGWGCSPSVPVSQPTILYGLVPLMQIEAYDRQMAMFQPGQINSGNAQNGLFVDNIRETIVQEATNNQTFTYSADATNLPFTNAVREYDSNIGTRVNVDYAEGEPVGGSVVASGGSLAAGSYNLQVTFAVCPQNGQWGACTGGNPGTPTSTDGYAPIVVGGTGTDSVNVALPCDANYVAYIYFDTSTPPAHFATVNGVNAAQVTMCQIVTITAVGSAATPIQEGLTVPSHSEFKTAFTERYNVDTQINKKNDTYAFSCCGAANGGRIGNWEGRWNVSSIGNVDIQGTTISNGVGPVPGLADVNCRLCNFNPTNSTTDLSWVTFGAGYNRSAGSIAAGTFAASPALNLGMGDYCPQSTTNVGSQVPSGLAAFPWDIEGIARRNDGTGFAGAYETGCL